MAGKGAGAGRSENRKRAPRTRAAGPRAGLPAVHGRVARLWIEPPNVEQPVKAGA